MTIFTKIDATGIKINFFEFRFFCQVGKLTYYKHLKRFEAAQKKGLAVTIVGHIKIFSVGKSLSDKLYKN